MTDYISREAALAFKYNSDQYDSRTHRFNLPVVDVYDILDVPAADVREVVRGKWIGELVDDSILAPFKTKAWKCDQCGYEYVNPYREQPHNFCPNCGADMRGNDNDE